MFAGAVALTAAPICAAVANSAARGLGATSRAWAAEGQQGWWRWRGGLSSSMIDVDPEGSPHHHTAPACAVPVAAAGSGGVLRPKEQQSRAEKAAAHHPNLPRLHVTSICAVQGCRAGGGGTHSGPCRRAANGGAAAGAPLLNADHPARRPAYTPADLHADRWRDRCPKLGLWR